MKDSGGFGRIHLVQILVIAALVVVTAIALIPLQRTISDRMESLKNDLILNAELSLGRRISYSSISPSIFRYLDVRDLRILGRPGERDVLIDIGRVRIHYSIVRLFSAEPLNALTELRLENSSIVLDEERDGDVLRFLHEVIAGNGAARESAGPPGDLRIRGDNLRLRYHSSESEHWGEGVSLLVHLRGANIDVSVDGNFGYSRHGGGRVAIDGASIQGTLVEYASTARFQVEVPVVRTRAATVMHQTFQIDYDGQRVDVQKIRDRSPVDLALVYDPQARTVEIDFLADGIIPAEIVRLEGAFAFFNPWLLGETSGRGRLRYAVDSGSLDYDLNITNRVRNPGVPEPIVVAAVVRGDTGRAEFERVIVYSSEGHAIFQGDVDLASRQPTGRLDFSSFRYGDIRPFSASFRVAPEHGWVVARTDQVRYGEEDFFDVELAARNGENGTSYRASAFLDQRRGGRVELSGASRGEAQPSLVLVTDFTNAPLAGPFALAADLVPGFPRGLASRFGPSLILDARIAVSLNEAGLSVEAPFVSLYDAERPGRYAAFGLYSSDTDFEIRHAILGENEHQLRGGLFATIAGDRRIDFSAEVSDGRWQYDIEGLIDRERNLVFRGNHGLDGRVYLTGDGGVVFSARAESMPLPFTANGARLSVDVSGMFLNARQWDASLRKLIISDAVYAGRSFNVDGRGRLNAEGGRIDRLVLYDETSRISGSGTVSYDLFADGGGNKLQLALAGEETAERYELQAMYDRGQITAAVVFERSPLARTAVDGIRGAVNGVLTIDGEWRQPRLTADFQVVDAALNNDAFSANGRIEFSDGVISFDSIRGQYVTNSLSGGRGTIDLRASMIDLQATIRNNARHRAEPRTVRLRTELTSDDDQVELLDLLAGEFRGTIRVDGLDILPERYGNWVFAIDRDEQRIAVHGGPSDAIAATIQTSGQFRVEMRHPLPIQFVAAGSLRDGEIEANITQILLQVDQVPDLFDLGTLVIYDGLISGGVRAVGPLADPDLFGTLTAENVHANLEYLPESIGPARIHLVLQEKQLQLAPFETAVGRGGGNLRGTIVLHRWTVDEFQLDIETDDFGVPVVYTFGGLSVDGFGVGRLRIAGVPGMTSVTGDVVARATTLAVSPREELPDPRRDSMTTVDLTLRTGRRVEFLWPSREFPVIRSFAQANERLQLHYSDESGTFRLRGGVGIQGGEIYYFDRNFYIREGNIVFDETEELFDPRLRARAELREVGRDGPVRIFLIADGSRLSEFQPRFESSPIMTDAEIAALIGGGLITGSADDVFNISTAMLATTDIVPAFGIMSSVENSIRDALRLDLFSVRTQLFQNLVVGAIDETGDEPLDNTSPSLGQYLDNTTVFLGKYLGSSLFLELLVQIRARNPLEVEVESVGGIEVDTELGLEFQTPFFNLHWSLFPQNPQNLFVTDTTFAFSWGFSY